MSKNTTLKQRDSADVQDRIDIAVMKSDVSYIKTAVMDVRNSLTSGYVSRDEFDPVKKIVYGMVGLILVGVVGALMALILRK